MTSFRHIPLVAASLAVGLCLMAGLGVAQTKSSAAKKSPTKTSAKKTTKAATPAPASPSVSYRRSKQQTPTRERYQEIERALEIRGYLQTSADGKWDQESVDALKRFQRDQSLKDDGILGALSLIGLGLGPQRPATTVAQTANGSPQVE